MKAWVITKMVGNFRYYYGKSNEWVGLINNAHFYTYESRAYADKQTLQAYNVEKLVIIQTTTDNDIRG